MIPHISPPLTSGKVSVDRFADGFPCRQGYQHVELHLEVDPNMTVQASHDLATSTRFLSRDQLDSIADVVVHGEPFKPDASRPGA